MKKTVLCVIFAIFLCSSCQSAGLEKKYTVPGSVPDTSAKQPDIPETDNFTDYNDLITKTDDIHYIAENFFSSNIYGSGSISDIAGTVGIECLRETGNGGLYSLHKIKQGGLLYIFYTNSPDSPDYHDIIRWFYVRKKLSSEDFKNLKLNESTMDSVIQIDETVQIFKNIFEADKERWESESGMPVWIYLDDGIMELGFSDNNGKTELFFKEHTDDYILYKTDAERQTPYSGEILDIDRIK